MPSKKPNPRPFDHIMVGEGVMALLRDLSNRDTVYPPLPVHDYFGVPVYLNPSMPPRSMVRVDRHGLHSKMVIFEGLDSEPNPEVPS